MWKEQVKLAEPFSNCFKDEDDDDHVDDDDVENHMSQKIVKVLPKKKQKLMEAFKMSFATYWRQISTTS